MIENPSPAMSRVSRVLLTVVALGVSLAIAIWLLELQHQVAILRTIRLRVHELGYVLPAFFVTAVAIGSALHVVRAARRGASFAAAARYIGLLLAYGAAVALLTWLVAPEKDTLSSGRGGGVGGAYAAWLIFVWLPLTVLVCAGGVFARPAAGKDSSTTRALASARHGSGVDLGVTAPTATTVARNTSVKAFDVVLFTSVVSWVFGVLPFLVLVISALARLA